MAKEVALVLINLSDFFIALCSEARTEEGFKKLKEHVVHLLCGLEKIFSPSVLDVMVHLTVHLPIKVMISGLSIIDRCILLKC